MNSEVRGGEAVTMRTGRVSARDVESVDRDIELDVSVGLCNGLINYSVMAGKGPVAQTGDSHGLPDAAFRRAGDHAALAGGADLTEPVVAVVGARTGRRAARTGRRCPRRCGRSSTTRLSTRSWVRSVARGCA
jgi:hypothetical protein